MGSVCLLARAKCVCTVACLSFGECIFSVVFFFCARVFLTESLSG